MAVPMTKAGRDLASRLPDLIDDIAAIDAEASAAIDDERLARALVRLWPTRHGRDAAGNTARAIAVAYNLERPTADRPVTLLRD
jgi:hypothetical protein